MHHPDSDGHIYRNELFNAFGDLSKAMLGTSGWVTSVNGELYSDCFHIRSCSVTKHDTDEENDDDADAAVDDDEDDDYDGVEARPVVVVIDDDDEDDDDDDDDHSGYEMTFVSCR